MARPHHLRFALYLVFLVLFFVWALRIALTWDAGVGWRLPRELRTLGAALMLVSALLAAICIGLFLSVGRGTPVPFDPPRALVVRGPYQYVRNPMMLGGFLELFGLAFFLSSPSILLFALGLSIPAHLMVVLWEEPQLERRFGEAYRQYKAQVPRWIPRIPSR